MSQLELALRADSSARHISFVETGRARPSEEMVLRLAEHLDVPVRERNALLVVAGYAPRFPETRLDDPAMEALRDAVERLLRGYEPYPALVVDAVYTVVAANRGVQLLLDGVPERLLAPPLNAMRLTLHPEGLAPRILNLPEWRADLLAQMRRQIALVRSPSCGPSTRKWRTTRRPRDHRVLPALGVRTLTGRHPRCPCGSRSVGGCCRSSPPSPPSTRRWT